MSENEIPKSLEVPMASLVNLAIEWWRLSSAPSASAGPGRHAIRRIEDFLSQCELQAQSMDGKPFDPGMALRVVDVVDDPSLANGEVVIEQTLSPMVLWRGRVVKEADVVTRRGVGM